MARFTILSAALACHFLIIRSAVAIPAGTSSNPMLQQGWRPSAGSDASGNAEDLTRYAVPPKFRADAVAYFTSSEQGPIIEVNNTFSSGVPPVDIPLQVGPLGENNYAYYLEIQNSMPHPRTTFSKFDLSKNLFQAAFDLSTQIPGSGRGPKTPYPGRRFVGAKYPSNLPGRLDMYLDDNNIGYEMWYRDLVFILKYMFDAHIGNPQAEAHGYFDLQVWCFLNGSKDPHKTVHGYFRPG